MNRAMRSASCAVVALFATISLLHAVATQPITDPAVFRDVAVNSFVLPYRYVGDASTDELRRASRQIAALAHFEILFSMIKYGSVGSIDLVDPNNTAYDVDDIIAKISNGSTPKGLQKGQTLVVTWGRLFAQGDQLYVQSYVRFLRQGDGKPELETIRVALGTGETPLELSARLPSQATAFPPRQISKADLAKVTEKFKKTMVVRPERDVNVPGSSIDFNPDKVFPTSSRKSKATGVARADQGRPEGLGASPHGNADDPWSLGRWLPELSYIDAICGFMRLRAGQRVTGTDGSKPHSRRNRSGILSIRGSRSRRRRSTPTGSHKRSAIFFGIPIRHRPGVRRRLVCSLASTGTNARIR
jgi:hypothetical protein